VNRFNRRDTIKLGAGALAGATILGSGRAFAEIPTADVAPPEFEIEDGASLRVLRPSKFVEGDERLFMENTKKFTEQTGINVQVNSESWEDLRPKTAVAANVGSGPDIVLAWSDDPHQFPDSTLDLTDLATYLGKKYGGWYPLAERYGTSEGTWIAMPFGASGGRVVHRKSWINEAGYDTVPEDLDGFLDLNRKLKETGHAPGFAVGHAVGDANSWCHWVVWAHGGAMVDEENKVTIDSPETIQALEYAKALYETFVPGTLSWLDSNNNKAYLSGEIGLTSNGISVYYAAKTSEDKNMQAVAEDTYHARMPVGPAGKPTERALIINSMIFNYTEYPNAAKEYLRFMMEKEQYDAWLNACIGYWGHPLKAYENSSVWTADPKHEAYKTVIRDSLWDGYKGDLGPASSAVLAEYIMVDMVASVCAGQATPQEAAAEAARRAQRYYEA
jgi:multiple sugar transport system substrate-binding protein